MINSTRILLALFVLLLLLLPAAAAAQQSQRETIIAQVNFTTPAGRSYIGTVIGERSVSGDQSSTEWSFNGTVNGVPASASGTAIERWTGNGYEMEVTSVDSWNVPFDRSILPASFTVSQVSPGLISIYGVPVAIDQPLQAPGSGDIAYTVTAAGQGSPPVASLPNTAGSFMLPSSPLLTSLALLGMGILLIVVSRLLRRAGSRSAAISAAVEE